MSTIDSALAVSVAAGALRAATPVVYAGLGALISERSGVINLGLEGLMLVGACSGVWAQLTFGNWLLSLAVAGICGGLVGLAHAFFCVTLRASQVVTGLAFFFLCQGLTAVFGVGLVGKPVSVGVAPPLTMLRDIPVVGPVVSQQDVMVLGAFLATAAVSFFLFKTRWGVLLRACGESAVSAAAAGVMVNRARMVAGFACGIFCGLGGAHLALFYARQWQENMMSGRGWIALVMVIFGMWFPWRLVMGAYLFGGMATLQLNLQARGIAFPQYLLATLPFVVTLALLVLASWRLRRIPGWMPADLGNPYHPESEGKL